MTSTSTPARRLAGRAAAKVFDGAGACRYSTADGRVARPAVQRWPSDTARGCARPLPVRLVRFRTRDDRVRREELLGLGQFDVQYLVRPVSTTPGRRRRRRPRSPIGDVPLAPRSRPTRKPATRGTHVRDAGQRAPRERDVEHVGGQHTDVVERRRQWERPRRVERVEARLHPDDAAHDAGVLFLCCSGVGADRYRDDAPWRPVAADPDDEPPGTRFGSCGCAPDRKR